MVDHSAGSSGNVGNRAKDGGASWHWQIKLRQVHRSTPQEMYWSFPESLFSGRGKSEKRLTSSRIMNKTLLTMNGHLRPYRSAAIPKRIEPTDRNISTRVIPQVISVLVLLVSVSSRKPTALREGLK